MAGFCVDLFLEGEELCRGFRPHPDDSRAVQVGKSAQPSDGDRKPRMPVDGILQDARKIWDAARGDFSQKFERQVHIIGWNPSDGFAGSFTSPCLDLLFHLVELMPDF